MATIHLQEVEMHTHGEMPAIGSQAPDVPLTKTDLSTIRISDFDNVGMLINVYPSIDTSVCFDSVKNFQKQLPNNNNTQLICVSMDLPFSLQRIATGENDLKDILFLSDFRNREFGEAYGLTIADGPLAGILARAVIVLDKSHQVVYTELVSDVSNPPNYEAALAALNTSN